ARPPPRATRVSCVAAGPEIAPHTPQMFGPHRRSWGALSCESVVAGRASFAEGGDALGEVGAGPDAVAELLVQRLARAGVLGDRRADLPLDGLHRPRPVRRDRLGRLQR